MLLAFASFFYPSGGGGGGGGGLNPNERTHSMLNICITIPGLSLTFNIAYEL